jgi:hypothetical protein
MRFFFFFSLFFLFLVGTLATISFSANFVSAEDAPNYNFGSMQGALSLSIKPGDEVSTRLYFYNLYGNRPTHIKLNVTSASSGVKVIFSPALEKKDYDVSGEKVSVQENLVVYPSNASQEKGENTASIEYISSKVGWIASNFVSVTIKAPENAKVGSEFKVKLTGTAFWLGQGGSIALQQQRDFEYSVKIAATTSSEYYEKPYEENSDSVNRTGVSLAGLFGGRQENPGLMIAIGSTALLILVLLILIIILIRRKRKNKVVKVRRRKK